MPDEDVETTDSEATEETAVDVESTADAEPETTDYKSKWEAQRKVNRDMERKFQELTAKHRDAESKIAEFGKTQEQIEKDRAQREVEQAALAKANDRILRSEIKAVAAGKLADPTDAALYLDLSKFEVGDDGGVDTEAIEDAISDLLTRKPHLAAKAPKFGTVNQSAKVPAQPGQLSLAEYEALSREDRRKAREAGRVRDLLGS